MRIHQMGSVLSAGDAVTNHIIEIDRRLRAWGFEADIFGANISAAPTASARLDSEYAACGENDQDILLYHYSAYCENYELFRRSRNRKVLIYHNITPAGFFGPYDAVYETLCRRGRELLGDLAECDWAAGVSEYNRQELVAAGFSAERTSVLPLFIGEDDFRHAHRDDALYRRLRSGGVVNVVFVGKVAPNKAFEDLIKLFCAYNKHINPASRLILAGARFLPRYDLALDELVARLSLGEAVMFTGRARLPQLLACYQAADLFVCASRHEGFCVPLLEAMYFHLPILARLEAAVPETLGSAGVLFSRLEYSVLAELIDVLIRDTALRSKLITAQDARLADFAPTRVEARLRDVLRAVGVAVPPGPGG